MGAARPMTLAVLIALQDVPVPPVTQREGWIAAVAALVPTAILFWREWSKGRAEREASTVAGYKDLYAQQTANLVAANAANAALVKENGELRDKLTAERIAHADCKADLRHTREDLDECRGVRRPAAEGQNLEPGAPCG